MALIRSLQVIGALAVMAIATLPVLPQNKPAPPVADDVLLFNGQPVVIQNSGLRGWSCCVTADGKTLITCAGTGEQAGEIQIWNLADGKVVRTITHTVGIRCVAIVPGHQVVAAGCYDGMIRMFDLATGNLRAVGKGHTVGVNGIVFTSDGKRLITAGLDRTVKVWQAPTIPAASSTAIEFTPYASLEVHTNRVFSVAVSKDGRSLASGGADNNAYIWDMPEPAKDGKLMVVKKTRHGLSMGSATESIAFSPDGRTLALGRQDGLLRLHDADTAEHRRDVFTRNNQGGLGVLALAFTPDGEKLVMGLGNSGQQTPGEVRALSVDGGDEGYAIAQSTLSPVRGVAVMPDGKTVVSISEDRTVMVKTIGDEEGPRELKAPGSAAQSPQIVLAVAWSPDGKTLAVAGENRGIALHDQTTKQVRAWTAHDDVISALAYSPDRKHLASASYDGTVKVWNLDDWPSSKEAPSVRVFTGHANWVFAVAFNSDGSQLASGSYDKTIRIWDTMLRPGGSAPPIVIKGKEGHTAGVRSLAFLPGDQELVSAGADRTIRFWNTKSGKPRGLVHAHKGAIRALAVSPDGTRLATGGEDRAVKLWEFKRSADAIDLVEKSDLPGHQDMIGSLAYSPGGRTLAVGTWNGSIHLWDPISGRQRTTMGFFGQAISSIAFSPDGQKLAAGSYDRTVRVWSPAAPPPPPAFTYSGHDQAVNAVAISRDGRWVATGDQVGVVRLFERSGKLTRTLQKIDPAGVSGLAFTGDGQKLIIVGRGGALNLWTTESSESKRIDPAMGALFSVACSADGKFFAIAGENRIVSIRDAASGNEVKRLTGHNGNILALDFSPDGSMLASAGADRTFRIWDTKTWAVKHQSPGGANNGMFHALAFSPDGRTLALAHNQDQIITPDGQLEQQQFRQVMIIDTTTGQPRTNAQGLFFHNDWVTGVGFAPDGQTLITTSRDMYLRFWSVSNGGILKQTLAHRAPIFALAVDHQTGQVVTGGDDRVAALWSAQAKTAGPRASLSGQTGQVWFAEYSKDGTMLATGGDDKIVRVRRGMPGAHPFAFTGTFPACFSLAVSPDGATIASGHLDGTINLWDSTNGKKIKTLNGHSTQVWSLVFVDNQRLVSSSGSWERRVEEPGQAKLWDIAKGAMIREFNGQTGAIYAAVPSPDGKTLATGSHDRTIRLWELETGKLKQTLKGHSGGIRTLAFLKDGKTLVSGSHEESTFIFWNVADGKEKSRHVLPNSTGNVNRIRVSPDGQTLAIVVHNPPPPNAGAIPDSADGLVPPPPLPPSPIAQIGELLLWDLKSNKVRGQSGSGTRMLDCSFSPDGKVIAAAGGIYAERGDITLWSGIDGRRLGELHGPKRWLEAVTFCNDGRLLTGGGIVRTAQPRQQRFAVPAPVPVAMGTSSPTREPGELHIWDLTGLAPELELKGHSKHVTCGAYHPDGTLLATGSGDRTVIVWTLKSGSSSQRVLKHDGDLRAVRFSPDGKVLAAGDESGKIKLWNPLNGDLIKTIDAHALPVYNLAFGPDGKTLVSCAGNWRTRTQGEVKFWTVSTGEQQGEVVRIPSAAWSAAFHPKDNRLAIAGNDGMIRVYGSDRKLMQTLRTTTPVRNLAFSPDGALLAAGQNADNDPTVRIWESSTWQEKSTMQGHGAMIFTVRFSPDGKSLATASKDSTVKFWDIPK